MKCLGLIPVILFFDITQACSCTEYNSENTEYFNEVSEYVFVGTVISEQNLLSLTKNKYKFKIKKMYKGKNSDHIEVWTNVNIFDSCVFTYQVGKEYLVYTHHEKKKLISNSCKSFYLENHINENLKTVEEYYSINKNVNVDSAEKMFPR